MNAVADMFDHDGAGLIDWKEFIAALRPDWEEKRPPNEAEKIHDEVKRLVMLCTCRQKFRVFQVGEGKYRVRTCKIFIYWNYFVFYERYFINNCCCSSETVKSCVWSVSWGRRSWFVLAVVGWRWTNFSSKTILVVVRIWQKTKSIAYPELWDVSYVTKTFNENAVISILSLNSTSVAMHVRNSDLPVFRNWYSKFLRVQKSDFEWISSKKGWVFICGSLELNFWFIRNSLLC